MGMARPRPELEHGTVPLDCLPLVPAKDEPRPPGQLLLRAADVPPPLHPQVAPKDKPALEREEEVLADRLDSLQPLSVQPLGEPQDRCPRMRRLDGDDLPLEDANAVGRTTKTVSLRHSSENAR